MSSGPGYADGAVMGNVFTSPSAAEAAAVGRAASGGAGVLLTTGNYAGDVLNFGLAAERLEAEGIPARYVAVTDDVASVGKGANSERRGIAGDVPVFKCAGAAAEEGMDLDDVERVARKTNERTRTLGVAFGGCTLPGADGPLFDVPRAAWPWGWASTASPASTRSTCRPPPSWRSSSSRASSPTLPRGCPTRSATAGRWRRSSTGSATPSTRSSSSSGATSRALLRERGLEVVEPEVGELVTSLDMAGCSLTLTWLDDEVERLWRAPADTPAYRKGGIASGTGTGSDWASGAARSDEEAAARGRGAPADDRSGGRRGQGRRTPGRRGPRRWSPTAWRRPRTSSDASTRSPATETTAAAWSAGRPRPATRPARPPTTAAAPRTVLQAAGDEWAARAGGTSGVLWGELLVRGGASASATTRRRPRRPSPRACARGSSG